MTVSYAGNIKIARDHVMKKVTICAYLENTTVPEFVRLFCRSAFYLKSEGIFPTIRQIVKKSMKICGLGSKTKPKNNPAVPDETLNLKAGDVVEVKSAEEIRKTLDRNDKTKGLLFMAEMWKFCGKQFVVYKRIDTILIESTGKQRHPKNTVLLENVHCDGSDHSNCDSSCFHFWREAWLRKVEKREN